MTFAFEHFDRTTSFMLLQLFLFMLLFAFFLEIGRFVLGLFYECVVLASDSKKF